MAGAHCACPQDSTVPKEPRHRDAESTSPVPRGTATAQDNSRGRRGSDELPAAPAAGCVEAPALRADRNPVSLWIPALLRSGRGSLGRKDSEREAVEQLWPLENLPDRSLECCGEEPRAPTQPHLVEARPRWKAFSCPPRGVLKQSASFAFQSTFSVLSLRRALCLLTWANSLPRERGSGGRDP